MGVIFKAVLTRSRCSAIHGRAVGLSLRRACSRWATAAAVLPRLALQHVDVLTTPTDRSRSIDVVVRAGSRTRPAIGAVLAALAGIRSLP